jgi:hypothetical protein
MEFRLTIQLKPAPHSSCSSCSTGCEMINSYFRNSLSLFRGNSLMLYEELQ